jgi:glutamate/tyrosine decarboxylase-like PLP-dependent enzyme
VYASAEVHMSVPKALALLGVGRASLRLIGVDEAFRMRTEELESAIERDRRAGIPAIAVVATAGTTSTGAVDPLREIAAVARAHGLWLHVDGAYGGLAALAVPELFGGLSQADSISLDAHKWLYQPLDCSVLLYRDAGAARRAFAYTGEYARSLSGDPVEGFTFFEESLELSRRFRALKLWLSLRYHGVAEFRAAIRADLRHARQLAGAAGTGRAQRGVLPLEGRRGGGPGSAQCGDPGRGTPPRARLPVQRQYSRRLRAPRLHREPPHHRRRHRGCRGRGPGRRGRHRRRLRQSLR